MAIELIDNNGYITIKTEEGFKPKHRVLYEKYHGIKLKPGQRIRFVDGNRDNFDIDNLKLINSRLPRFEQGAPSTRKPVGYERVTVDGYTVVKTELGYVRKHRLLYEQHHGVKLTSDQRVGFIDGDKTNLSIDNLKIMAQGELVNKPVGHESVDGKGYIRVKTAEGRKLKHRVLYEQHHGVRLTPKQRILFIDGNKRNITIENLMLKEWGKQDDR